MRSSIAAQRNTSNNRTLPSTASMAARTCRTHQNECYALRYPLYITDDLLSGVRSRLGGDKDADGLCIANERAADVVD